MNSINSPYNTSGLASPRMNKALVLLVALGVCLCLAGIVAMLTLMGTCKKAVQGFTEEQRYDARDLSKPSAQIDRAQIWLDAGSALRVTQSEAFQLILKEINHALKLSLTPRQTSHFQDFNLTATGTSLHFVFSELDRIGPEHALQQKLTQFIQQGEDRAVGVTVVQQQGKPYYFIIAGLYRDVEAIFDKLNNAEPGSAKKGYLNYKYFTIYTQQKLKTPTSFIKDAQFLDNYSSNYYVANEFENSILKTLKPGFFMAGTDTPKAQPRLFLSHTEPVQRVDTEEASPGFYQTYTNVREHRPLVATAGEQTLKSVLELKVSPQIKDLEIRQVFVYAPRRFVPLIKQIYANNHAGKVRLTQHDPCARCNSKPAESNPEVDEPATEEAATPIATPSATALPDTASECEARQRSLDVTGTYITHKDFNSLLSSPEKPLEQHPKGSPCHSDPEKTENICAIGIQIQTQGLPSGYTYQAHVQVFPSTDDADISKMYQSHLKKDDQGRYTDAQHVLDFHRSLLSASVPQQQNAAARELLAEFHYFFKIEK